MALQSCCAAVGGWPAAVVCPTPTLFLTGLFVILKCLMSVSFWCFRPDILCTGCPLCTGLWLFADSRRAPWPSRGWEHRSGLTPGEIKTPWSSHSVTFVTVLPVWAFLGPEEPRGFRTVGWSWPRWFRQCKPVGKPLGCFLTCQAGLSTWMLLDTCLQHVGRLG